MAQYGANTYQSKCRSTSPKLNGDVFLTTYYWYRCCHTVMLHWEEKAIAINKSSPNNQNPIHYNTN